MPSQLTDYRIADNSYGVRYSLLFSWASWPRRGLPEHMQCNEHFDSRITVFELNEFLPHENYPLRLHGMRKIIIIIWWTFWIDSYELAFTVHGSYNYSWWYPSGRTLWACCYLVWSCWENVRRPFVPRSCMLNMNVFIINYDMNLRFFMWNEL